MWDVVGYVMVGAVSLFLIAYHAFLLADRDTWRKRAKRAERGELRELERRQRSDTRWEKRVEDLIDAAPEPHPVTVEVFVPKTPDDPARIT